MVISAVAASYFFVGALIFVVSLAAALCTRRYRFMSSFYCVPISKTSLAARSFFIIFVNSSFACSPRVYLNLGDSFSLKVSRSGVEKMLLVFIRVDFCTSMRLYSFFSSLP